MAKVTTEVSKRTSWMIFAGLLALACLLSSCAPLLVAGGAAGGYAAAKDMEDGQLIDDKHREGV